MTTKPIPPQQPPDPIMETLKDDPVLAAIIKKGEGLEACYPHLRKNKAKLGDEKIVHAWILAAQIYTNHTKSAYESIALLHRVYEGMLELAAAQAKPSIPIGSGTILHWLGTFYFAINFQRASERYFATALCSDIIGGNPANHIKLKLGAYPALKIRHKHPEGKLSKWMQEAITTHKKLVAAADSHHWIPDNLLTHIKTSLIADPPSVPEARTYPVNRFYLKRLLTQAEDRQGKTNKQVGDSLELLGNYLFQCIPGCITKKEVSETGIPDILVRTIDPPAGFRATLGEYFLCECKNESGATDVQGVSQILDALMETNCAFGVLLTLTGTTAPARHRIKLAHIKGVTSILTLSKQDIISLTEGEQLIGLLQEKFEKLRFHHKAK